MSISRRLATRIAPLVAALTVVSACSGGGAGSQPDSGEPAESAAGYPVTTRNCGHEVTFDAPPERVMLLESAPVTILDGIGAFDTVISRAGSFPPEYYDDELAAAVGSVPALSEDIDASGHLMISQEEVIAQSPDLVLGLPDGVTREGLSSVGAEALVQELYCPEPEAAASFETLYQEIDRYGMIFDRTEEASALVQDLQSRVAAVEENSASEVGEEHSGGESNSVDTEPLTAAVLYPSAGGGPLYAYGTGSMAHPQLEAAGLENVFATSDERVFEVQAEQLIARDPDVLVLLYQGDEDGVEQSVTSLPGAETISAVDEDRIITQLFNFTEPASPLSVEGLELIDQQLREGDG